MQRKIKDKIDRFLCAFVNMSDKKKISLMQKLSFKMEKLEHQIKVLEEKQVKVFELYFKKHKTLDNLNITPFYKKLLECKSKYYDNKILKLHKKSTQVEIDMLYGSLADKKSRGLDIEIAK